MSAFASKSQENDSPSIVSEGAQRKSSRSPASESVDKRSEAGLPASMQTVADSSPRARQAAQLKVMMENHASWQQNPIQRKANKTGLPDNLKSGIESLSGMSMDHVKVHYNSSEPAQLNAHAYAQGSDIHVAPGQEQHLPHEAWHVVQQAQGRVQPTRQMKQGVPVNDDAGLEAEADTMGAMALRLNPGNAVLQHYRAAPNYATGAIQRLSMKRRGAFPAVDASFAVGAHVFVAPAKNSIDAEIPALDEDEANINVNLYFGQDYLNNELSQTYHGNGGAIKKEKARIGWDGTNNSNAVILDGHHRVIWGLYHNQEVGFNTSPITPEINLADVTYKGTPKPIVVAPKAEEKKEDVKDATPKDKTATTSAAATPVVGGVD